MPRSERFVSRALVAVVVLALGSLVALVWSPTRPATAQQVPALRAAKQALPLPVGVPVGRTAARPKPARPVTVAAGPLTGPTLPVTVRRLSPRLRHRLALATRAARADGVRLQVTSGWRSPQQQERLIRRYTRQTGSRVAAYRWALPVRESLHVTGDAVDLGAGAGWLRAHGHSFGLCRRYRSEPWHFEMLTEPGGRCPALQDHPVARATH